MLLPREQAPWNCAYALGAFALQALARAPGGKADVVDLRGRMSVSMNREISMSQVVAALAWLYLSDSVELDADGFVRLCT